MVDGLVARAPWRDITIPRNRRRVGHDLTDQGRRVLELADAEVECRLSEIAGHRPDRAATACNGLGAWREALDTYGTPPRGSLEHRAAAI